MDKYAFSFVIDISGTPYSNITLGLCTFEMKRYSDIIKEFGQQFPEFRRSRNKGCTLKHNRLQDILTFLNSRGVHMSVLHFSGMDWHYYKQKYSNKAFFKEKIMACLYFMLISKNTRIDHKTLITVDNDSWMDIHKAFSECKSLALANHYDFDISIGYSTQDDRIRLADFIASSYTKIPRKWLDQIENYKVIPSEIPGMLLSKVFR